MDTELAKLKAEIKELKGDNEKLKENNDEWMEEALDMRKELKVINDKLGLIIFDADDWKEQIIEKIAPELTAEKVNKKLKEENKKLKELNEELKELNEEFTAENDTLEEENRELKAENAFLDSYEKQEALCQITELKDKLEDSESTMRGAMSAFMKCQKDYNRLEEENKKLKEIENKVNAFKTMLKETCELEEDDEDWKDTWEIIEETLNINSHGVEETE